MAEMASLSSVAYLPEASGLVGDHAAGATVLTVSSGRVFGDLGTARVNGVDYPYLRDGDTLSIDLPGLVAAAEDGDPVERINAAGNPEGRVVAFVSFDEEGDEDDEAEVPAGMRGYFPEGVAAAGTVVDVESTEYGYQILSRPFDPDSLDPDTILTPYLTAWLPADVSIPHGTITTVSWGGNVRAARVVPGGSGAASYITVPRAGIYVVTATAAFATNNAGNRYVFIHIADADGTDERVERTVTTSPPSNPSGTAVVQAVKPLPLEEGERVIMKVQQTSGAALNLLGRIDLTALELTWIAAR